MVFVGQEKVFNNVDWNKLSAMLRNTGFKNTDRRILAEIFSDQTAAIKIDGQPKEDIIKKGEITYRSAIWSDPLIK